MDMQFFLKLMLAALASLVVFPASAGEPISHPTRTEPWSLQAMNDTIAQTNFIVGSGCSGTLISLKYKLVLTNHHCIDSFFRYVEREEVVDSEVKKVRREERRDVPLSQEFYKDYRKVGTATLLSEIVARKQKADLALLHIRSEKIMNKAESKVLPNGAKPVRGERVWVVGNPRGLDATVTFGIISSMNRTFRVSWADGAEVPFIQIDAAVNPGNSGGSLYNKFGYLIGVPAAMAGDSALGLAIPYTAIRAFLTENCYEDVWNDDGESHDECVERKEKEADEKK